MPSLVRPSSSIRRWLKALLKRFFDGFSPFSTVFPAGLNRDSPKKQAFNRFRRPCSR